MWWSSGVFFWLQSCQIPCLLIRGLGLESSTSFGSWRGVGCSFFLPCGESDPQILRRTDYSWWQCSVRSPEPVLWPYVSTGIQCLLCMSPPCLVPCPEPGFCFPTRICASFSLSLAPNHTFSLKQCASHVLHLTGQDSGPQ